MTDRTNDYAAGYTKTINCNRYVLRFKVHITLQQLSNLPATEFQGKVIGYGLSRPWVPASMDKVDLQPPPGNVVKCFFLH